MALVPIILNLVQDLTRIIYQYMTGPSKYRMSMVSHDWHIFCTSAIIPIKDNHDAEIAINQLDIIRIIRPYKHAFKYEYMRNATRLGNVELINILIKKGNKEWNSGLYGACEGGHVSIVKNMMSRGAHNYDNGLYAACINHHLEIAQLMLSYMNHFTSEINTSLFYACVNGSGDMIQLLINNGASNWDYGMQGACKGGHMLLVQNMIARGASNWTNGLIYACRGGHLDIVQLMIVRGADNIRGAL